MYDAWGQVSLGGTPWNWVALGELNPFRYRGYYYDTESGLYYLNSRYYDPQTCRFINADKYLESGHAVLGNNLFVYCFNNPVRYADPSGEFVITATAVAAVALLVGLFVVTVVAAVAIQYAMQELLEYIWTQGNTAIQIPIEQEPPDNVVPFPQQPKKPNKVSPPLSDPIPAPKPKDEDPNKGKYFNAYTKYHDGINVSLRPALSLEIAAGRLAMGQNIWTPTLSDAIILALYIDDRGYEGPERHDKKYPAVGHIHVNKRPSRFGHIFYGYDKAVHFWE